MTTSMVMTRTSIMTARVIVAIDEDWADECNYQLLQMCYLSLFSLPYTKRKDSVVLVLTLTYLCNISYSLSSYSQLRFALFHFKLPLYQDQEKGLGSTYFNTVSWVLLSRLVLQMCHLSFLASLVPGPKDRLGSTYTDTDSWVLLSRLIPQVCHHSFLVYLVPRSTERTNTDTDVSVKLSITCPTDELSFIFSSPCTKTKRKDLAVNVLALIHWCHHQLMQMHQLHFSFFCIKTKRKDLVVYI